MAPFKYDPIGLWEVIARLSNERDMSWRYTKKGDKRPLADIEAQKAGRRKAIKAKKAARDERNLAAARARFAARKGQDIQSRMLRAMEPDGWYGMGDLMRMTGEARSSKGKVHNMLRLGWVEVAQNPAWGGETLNPWEIMAGAEPQPQRLYRLTAAGLARRDKLISDVS